MRGKTLPFATPPSGIELWAIAVYDLGLTPDCAKALTLREFDLLRQRYAIAERRNYERTAMIMCTLININLPKGKRAIKVEDIIGQEKKKVLSIDDQIAFAKAITKTLGGKINGK